MLNRLHDRKHLPWIVAALYIVVTVWMTWPLTPNAGSAVQDPGDPLFEIWVMRTVQHRLVNDPLDLYDANAFYPFDGSLAYSEEAISTALLAWPVYLVTGNDVLAYNVMLLSAFWLVAFAVYLLARELGASPGAAFIAGIVASFAPARYAHLSHLHMLVIGWLPLALWALTRYVRGGRDRYWCWRPARWRSSFWRRCTWPSSRRLSSPSTCRSCSGSSAGRRLVVSRHRPAGGRADRAVSDSRADAAAASAASATSTR